MVQLAASVAPPRLASRAFILVCLSTFLGYAHLGLLTPVLPLFIQEQGGSALLVGLTTAAFSVTSFILRPMIGRLVDTWSARGVMSIGTIALGLSGLGYLVYQPLWLFLVRSVHGLAWAGYNTGAKVLVSTTAPSERRGEAAGYFSMAQGVATAVVPAIALWMLSFVTYAGVFVVSAAGGLLATLAALAIPPQPRRRAATARTSFWNSLVERSALFPSGLEFLTKLAQPAVATFVPLYATAQGLPIQLLAYFYLAYGLVGIAARGVLGRWSDRIGRGTTIAAGAATSALALLLFSLSADLLNLALAGALFGLGTAASAPAIMALAIDVAHPERPGAAMATYSMAFQLAVGVGATICGFVVDLFGFRAMYLVMTIPSLAAILLVLAQHRRIGSQSAKVTH
jgi:MFS family permease